MPTPMYEREAVLAAVRRLLDAAYAGRGGTAFVVAPAGLGKTSVMPEAQRAAFTELTAARPDRAITLPWALWRANFVQAADEQLARASHARLAPDPLRRCITGAPEPE